MGWLRDFRRLRALLPALERTHRDPTQPGCYRFCPACQHDVDLNGEIVFRDGARENVRCAVCGTVSRWLWGMGWLFLDERPYLSHQMDKQDDGVDV